MSAALLSSAPLSSISAPSESTRFLLPTHHKRLRLSSLTQHRLSLKLGTSRPLTLRCSSTMHQSSTPSSCSQDSLFYSRAFWVSRSIIAWNVGAGEGECYLYASRNAALCVADGEIQGHDVKIKLERTNYGLSQQEVRALIYKSPSEADPVEIVQLKELNGVWSVKGPRHWEGCYYVYEVSVYHPSTLRIEKCVSNDPYARGLSADGKRTLLVNLDSDDVKPEGWDNLQDEKPNLLSFSDISLYELHVRDFSANDPTVPHEFQGGYLAFTLQLVSNI